MMVVSGVDASRLEHRATRDLPEYLRSGDLIVVNSSRVLPARFEGSRADTGGHVEGLYLSRAADGRGAEGGSRSWLVLLKGSHLRAGISLDVSGAAGGPTIQLTLQGRAEDEPGAWVVGVTGCSLEESDEQVLEGIGKTPLPPYILSARKHALLSIPDRFDRDRYQTVYAQSAPPAGVIPGGSVAAPTAGLHLTPQLLAELAERGVGRAEVMLHVGTGTFKKVESEFVEDHAMHGEYCSVTAETVARILATKAAGGRVFCIGTTAARAVETYGAAHEQGQPHQLWRRTHLLITPGYRWRWTEGLLTNFHLPRSTLMALCGALLPGGVSQLRRLYEEAIRQNYRFFSYGDAMLILPE